MLTVKAIFENFKNNNLKSAILSIGLHSIIFIIYSIIYYVERKNFFKINNINYSKNGNSSNDKDYKVNTYIDSLYFSAVTHSTLGYGDIYPLSQAGKFTVFTHVCFIIILYAIF